MLTNKAWGMTATLLKTPLMSLHRITARPRTRCSWHKHTNKYNAFYCLKGMLTVHVEEKDGEVTVKTLWPGDYCTVTPGLYHWFAAGTEGATALELYYPEIVQDEDITRVDGGHMEDDDGKRVQPIKPLAHDCGPKPARAGVKADLDKQERHEEGRHPPDSARGGPPWQQGWKGAALLDAEVDAAPLYRHQFCCGNIMVPVKRLPWLQGVGERHIHHCEACGAIRIETAEHAARIAALPAVVE